MKRLNLTQGSPEWLEWRRHGVGGSDLAAIVGLSPYTDPPHTRADVFAAKVHGVERACNFAMKRGTRLEPEARLAYMTRFRCSAPPVCAEHAEFPWARVSLDGLCSERHPGLAPAFADTAAAPCWTETVRHLAKAGAPSAVVADALQDAGCEDESLLAALRAGGAQRGEWIIELKGPGWSTHDAALCGVVAEHFVVQVQWQMFVTGLDRCDFASFNPGGRFTPGNAMVFDEWVKLRPADRPPMPPDWLAVVPIEADRGRQEWLLGEAAGFWLEVEAARHAFDREARTA